MTSLYKYAIIRRMFYYKYKIKFITYYLTLKFDVSVIIKTDQIVRIFNVAEYSSSAYDFSNLYHFNAVVNAKIFFYIVFKYKINLLLVFMSLEIVIL